jgi:hypothetical protein
MRVADPHHFNADSDPAYTLLRIRIQLLTLIRIWIRVQLLLKVMGICDQWSEDPPRLHFEPPGLHCESPRSSTALFKPLKFLILT